MTVAVRDRAHQALGRPVALVVALFLVALNLRAAITSVPPMTGAIQRGLNLSGAQIGLITTLPVICMGAFAPPAAALARRIGRETSVGIALCLLAVGLIARLAGDQYDVLLLTAVLAGTGIAMLQATLPAIVKERFAERAGAATGIYTTGMTVGATLAAAMSVPLGAWFGSWRESLALWGVLAVLGLLGWVPFVLFRGPRTAPAPAVAEPVGRSPWRSRTGWLVAGYVGCQSIMFYSQTAWIAPSYEELGASAARAGLMFAVFNVAQLAAAATAPVISDRLGDRRPVFAAVLGSSCVGMVSLVAFPTAAPWVFLTILGIGQGGGFALGLVLLVDYAPDPAAATRLSGMVFLVGYLGAAGVPALLGGLRDATGGFTVPFTALLAVDIVLIPVISRLRPGRRP